MAGAVSNGFWNLGIEGLRIEEFISKELRAQSKTKP